jgi:uncharacterized protein YukE
MGIKSFFFEDDEKDKKEIKSTPPPPQEASPARTSFSRRLPPLDGTQTEDAPVPARGSEYVSTSREDKEKFHRHFDEVIRGAGLPGPNYFTFAQMLGEMGDLPDAAKYKAAFAALKVQGVSRDKLISTAKAYLDILDQDNSGFKSAVEQSTTEHAGEIQSIEKSVTDAQQAIKDIKAATEAEIERLQRDCDTKVKTLQDQIKTNQAKVAPLEEEIDKVQNKVRSYDQACQQYKASIQDDINKINTFIQ